MTTEHFASFDGTKLALHRVGEGRPFVLLHGLFSSAQMNWIKWGHAQRIAEQGYEALMLDFRVHGESEAPHGLENYPAGVLVKDVVALVGHLGLTDYDLGGFSLGARTAIHGVASGRLAPKRLILGGMGVDGLQEWEKRSAFFMRVIDEFDAIPKGDPAYFSMQFLKSQGVDRVAARLLLQSMEDLDLSELANIACPTLVVCGDEDRDNGSARELADQLPDATYVEVPGTHMSSVTKPDLGRAMAEWLAAARG
ncbi:alpha/beta fold hydrolase [Citromicrobium bathyomarinum]|uniref:alpha/beta fold hydrolase n=1 Tax=Alphaproteobacteria TaxID=28211 RepID=UPI000C0D2474|nr:alpha/beta fold hydrolase [Henriciella sp.]MBO81984.1 alpha/beta hydrolase [Citromicrobium sp.]PHR70065.1 MAG: alpha/beta hydrolase [Henriciella sp.]|tara:strand:- start:851 stop:1609 length:759 start_codon:yes stop_codon:yes gene_type:complete